MNPTVVRDGPYRVVSLVVGPYENNVYLLSDPGQKQALLIDAADNPAELLTAIAGSNLSHILTTHGHPDHVQALRQVKKETGALFTCHHEDAQMMPLAPDHELRDGEEFSFGHHRLKAIHTPGHTPGSVCFLIDDLLFSGDTLFPGGPGNTSGPTSSFPAIIDSIRTRLFTLPDSTGVFPGHGRPTTIGAERPHLDEWIARGW